MSHLKISEVTFFAGTLHSLASSWTTKFTVYYFWFVLVFPLLLWSSQVRASARTIPDSQ